MWGHVAHPGAAMRVRFRPASTARLLGARSGALALLLVSAAVASCEREERRFRVDPASADTIQTDQVTIPLPGTALRAWPAAADSYRPVTLDFQSNAYALLEGKRLYRAFNCVGCHAHGGGGDGPPPMDAGWVHRYTPAEVFDTIGEGRPDGMPAVGGRVGGYQGLGIVGRWRSLCGPTSP